MIVRFGTPSPDPQDISLKIEDRAYLAFDESPDVRIRHPFELVFRNGWLQFDYDSEGWLVGMQIISSDPGKVQNLNVSPYLQPKNPLASDKED